MSNASRPILDLCGGTGAWSKPYRDAGYPVTVVDPLADPLPGNFRGTVAEFLADLYKDEHDAGKLARFWGVLAAPPCTEFASSGARWWGQKSPLKLLQALEVVDQCREIIQLVRPVWWALENPVGRLRRLRPLLGKVMLTFDPCDYGDPYTKRTLLWGEFNQPEKRRVTPILNRGGSSPIHRMPPGPTRQRLRSTTPAGFAKAFFEANP